MKATGLKVLMSIIFSLGLVDSYRVVCYYENWSQYKTASRNAPLLPEDINPHMCTHINYAFAEVDTETHRINSIEWNDEELYGRLILLKEKNPTLKVMLSVGGYKLGVVPFISMASTAENRHIFITDSIDYLRRFGFDGLDIDWESPGQGGNPVQEKIMFTKLIQELWDAFTEESATTKQDRLLLSVAVSAHQPTIDQGYQAWSLSKSIDFMNLMAYDFHTGSWTNTLGHNAPLCGPPNNTKNVMSAVRHWEKLGMPANKIVLGIPAYGTAWKPHINQRIRVGENAEWSGALFYRNICRMKNDTAEIRYDSQFCAYFKSNGERWISYDPPSAFLNKCQMVKDGGYGGAMVWSLSMDDHHGQNCGAGKFPLHNAISKCLLESQTVNVTYNAGDTSKDKTIHQDVNTQTTGVKSQIAKDNVYGVTWQTRKLKSDRLRVGVQGCRDSDSCDFNKMGFVFMFVTCILCSLICQCRHCRGLSKLGRFKR